jgi:hypothetical protein
LITAVKNVYPHFLNPDADDVVEYGGNQVGNKDFRRLKEFSTDFPQNSVDAEGRI